MRELMALIFFHALYLLLAVEVVQEDDEEELNLTVECGSSIRIQGCEI